MTKEEFKINWAKWEGAQIDEWFDKMEALKLELEMVKKDYIRSTDEQFKTIAELRAQLESPKNQYKKNYDEIMAQQPEGAKTDIQKILLHADALVTCLEEKLAEKEELLGKYSDKLFSARDQLAERDADIEIHLKNSAGKWELIGELKNKLSQAQETIADFRSALEKMAKINPYHLDICATGESLIMRAKETLSKHPDSTEVKG